MGFFKRRVTLADRITPDALADFGRYEFLGPEQSGISDPYSLVSPLVSLSYNPEGPSSSEVIAELRRHSEKGEWEKVGAWKYARNFLNETADIDDLVDEGLLAIHRMRVTNLAIHLAPIDSPRYIELTGGPPANDGFFGPPVFDSTFGPTRQYYFDHAISTAAARRISRLASAPGAQPGPLDDAVKSMWDFGMLVYRGPLVVAPDIRFEPNVVKPAVEAATGVDHSLFAEGLVDGATDRQSNWFGPWTAIGASRFIEDYLEPTAADSPAYTRVTDAGLTLLHEMGIIGVGMTPEIFTPRQRERYSAIFG